MSSAPTDLAAGLAPPSATVPAGMEAIVTVSALVKRYPGRSVNAVDGVSFAVGRGEVLGLLGPNGAGKTTTVGVLTTRVRPTGGRAVVAGVDVARDPVAARRVLAVVPQRMNLDRALSARRNLLFHAAYFGIPAGTRAARADTLLDELGLADRANDQVDRFSGGQAQRLMIARALMHDPLVLFLDEPTTGLDPQARLFVWDRVRDLRARGVTVVLTTHDMDEAAALADRVGIMDHGHLLALDAPSLLTGLVPGRATLSLTVSPGTGAGEASAEELATALGCLAGVERVERVHLEEAFRLQLYCAVDAATLVAPVVQVVLAGGAGLSDVRLGQPSLEDVFIHLTGRGLRG